MARKAKAAASKAKEETPEQPKFKSLQKAGKAINAIFAEGDQIKTVGSPTPKLIEQLIEGAKNLDPKEDELDQDVVETLTALGCDMKGFEASDEEEEEEVEEVEEEEETDDGPDYVEVAEELNTLMDLEEPIDVKLGDADLKAEIIDVVNNDMEKKEFAKSQFTENTLFALEGLEVNITFKAEKKSKAKDKKKEETGKGRSKSSRKKEDPPAKDKAKGKGRAKPEAKETRKGGKRAEAKYEMANAVKKYIEKGKFTRKEIITKVGADLPHLNPSTIGTLVSDSKNPKYNKFDDLVVQDEDGILSFS